MRNSRKRRKAAFTLIELSIVLVIIGLIVGGILTGKQLVHAYELRSVVTEVNKLTATINIFRDKFRAYPGDMVNATSIWGAADNGDGVGSDCGDVLSTGTETCNGNGDNKILNIGTQNGVWEKFRIFQHLANAGLLPQPYPGAPGAGNVATIGYNWPAAKMAPGGYEIGYFAQGMYSNGPGNVIKIATLDGIDGTGLNGALLSPVDAMSIDGKIDDGLSNSGKFVALDSTTASGCVTNGMNYTPGIAGSYMGTNDVPSCRVYFYMGF